MKSVGNLPGAFLFSEKTTIYPFFEEIKLQFFTCDFPRFDYNESLELLMYGSTFYVVSLSFGHCADLDQHKNLWTAHQQNPASSSGWRFDCRPSAGTRMSDVYKRQIIIG